MEKAFVLKVGEVGVLLPYDASLVDLLMSADAVRIRGSKVEFSEMPVTLQVVKLGDVRPGVPTVSLQAPSPKAPQPPLEEKLPWES